MILSKVYEDAEHRLERNEITLGEFERLVDIEVIVQKRGEWVKDGSIEKCNQCGERKEFPHWGFCPACGADMRGINDEQ